MKIDVYIDVTYIFPVMFVSAAALCCATRCIISLMADGMADGL